MSVKVLNQVWQFSKTSGITLLVLLAIADFADDDGNAYPSIPNLAKKARCSERQAQRAIRAAEEIQELKVELKQGPMGSNRYKVQFIDTPQKRLKPPRTPRHNVTTPPVKMSPGGGDIHDISVVTRVSPNPSERSINGNGSSSSSKPCAIPDDDDEFFEQAVLRISQIPDAEKMVISRETILDLKRGGVSIEQIDAGLWLGIARSGRVPPYRAKESRDPIRSFRYFVPVIQEVLQHPPPPAQIEHIRLRIQQGLELDPGDVPVLTAENSTEVADA
jgi:hypothetical protein